MQQTADLLCSCLQAWSMLRTILPKLSNLQWLWGWPIKPCNGCGAGPSNLAVVVGLAHQTLQWLLGWPIQTAGLSNLAMALGLAYSNKAMVVQLAYSDSWPIKPCNGCRAGLSNHAMVAGLVYQNKKQLLSYLPIKTGKIVAGLAFPTL